MSDWAFLLFMPVLAVAFFGAIAAIMRFGSYLNHLSISQAERDAGLLCEGRCAYLNDLGLFAAWPSGAYRVFRDRIRIEYLSSEFDVPYDSVASIEFRRVFVTQYLTIETTAGKRHLIVPVRKKFVLSVLKSAWEDYLRSDGLTDIS